MRTKPVQEPAPTTWAEAVERFIGRLEERGKSKKTIRCYREELLAYAEWSEGEFKEPPTLQAIMESDLREWIAWLRAKKPARGKHLRLGPRTINKKRAAMKSFLRWSEVKGFSDPIEIPEAVKIQPGAIRWLARKDENALLRAVNKEKVLRDRTLIMFFLRCGARIEEASTVRLSRLKLQAQKGTVTIIGKGDKEREVPIDNETTKLLHQLVKTLEYPRGTDPSIFQGQRGALGVGGLHRIVTRYARLAKLPEITAHNLRHTCAKRLMDATNDPTRVAAILGHSNLNTTLIYLKAGEEDLRQAVNARAGEVDDSNEDEDEPPKPERRRR